MPDLHRHTSFHSDMAPIYKDESQKRLERVEAAIARASAKLMSNAKWHALFAALHESRVRTLLWKFVGDERIFTATIPALASFRTEGFGDDLPAPYCDFKELEWVEIPGRDNEHVKAQLENTRQFPVEETGTGLRIVAYRW